MNKVDVEPLDRWGFECPECGDWTEIDDNPEYQDYVECEGCGKRFEPNVIA